jgi:hypothetical protein
MKVSRYVVLVFLIILLSATFFALSAYVLKAHFCEDRMNQAMRLCDIVNALSEHNLFASAMVSLIVVFATMLSLRGIAMRAQEFLYMGHYSSNDSDSSPPSRIISWLRLRYNSPNIALRA